MKRMKRMLNPKALGIRGESLEGVRVVESFNDSDPLDRLAVVVLAVVVCQRISIRRIRFIRLVPPFLMLASAVGSRCLPASSAEGRST